MKTSLIVGASMTALLGALAVPAFAVTPLELAQQKACLNCHAVDHKLVGPSYKDVAAKYAKDPDALKRLSAKVRAGGSGVWGPIPMPPNAVTEAEADILVKWVLSQK